MTSTQIRPCPDPPDPLGVERRAQAIAMLVLGESRRFVAAHLKMGRNTLRRLLADPETSALIEELRRLLVNRDGSPRPGSGSEVDPTTHPAPSPTATESSAEASANPHDGHQTPDPDPIDLIRAVAVDESAPPSVRLQAARLLVEAGERRDGSRTVAYESWDPRSEPAGTIPPTEAVRIALALWDAAMRDLDSDQRAAVLVTGEPDRPPSPEKASEFVATVRSQPFPETLLHRVRDLPISAALDELNRHVNMLCD